MLSIPAVSKVLPVVCPSDGLTTCVLCDVEDSVTDLAYDYCDMHGLYMVGWYDWCHTCHSSQPGYAAHLISVCPSSGLDGWWSYGDVFSKDRACYMYISCLASLTCRPCTSKSASMT